MLFFTLALLGLFEATKNIGWMNLLGDLSYPLYLVHTGVLILVVAMAPGAGADAGRKWARTMATISAIGLFVAVSTVAALAVHKLLEEQVVWVLRALLQRRKIAARA